MTEEQQAQRVHPACIHKDETGIIRYINQATTDLLGWHPDDVIGHRSLEFIHPQDHDAAMVNWVRLLSDPSVTHRLRLRHRDSADHWVLMEVTNHNWLSDPRHGVVVTEMVPVTDDSAVEDSTWIGAQFLRRLTESLPVGVLQIDRGGQILFSNGHLDAIVGRPVARTLDEEFAGIVPADRAAWEQVQAAVLSGVDGDIEVSLAVPEVGVRHCAIRLRALTDRTEAHVMGAALCVIDVTDQARRRAEMERRATYDDLTRCLNRVSILAALGEALGRCDMDGVAVIFVDLDRFKPINDEYGHAAGDSLLRTVADRLRGAARDGDFVGRTGGDEFLVVCPAIGSPDAALSAARRMAAAVRRPVGQSAATLMPSCSTGVVWSRNPDESVESLVARADEAMYECKRRGDGRPVLAAAAHATPRPR